MSWVTSILQLDIQPEYYREFIFLKTGHFSNSDIGCLIVFKDILVNIFFFLSKKTEIFENLIFSMLFILKVNPIWIIFFCKTNVHLGWKPSSISIWFKLDEILNPKK